MNCEHTNTTFTPTPSGPHHGKTVCDDCGKFLRWEKKPETVERETQTAARIVALRDNPNLNEWEKGFIKSLDESGPKFSPRQLEILDRVWREKGGK